jgi:hypothetical protein
MKLATSCAFLLFSLLTAFAALAQTTHVDWVRGTDFGRFHTFTWATAAYAIQDPDANLGMARAVREELEAKGMQFVAPDQKFDVFITYNAKINQDPQDLSRELITLNVRIFDSRNHTVIWSAGGYVALGNNKPQNRSNVRGLLAEMFKKYPPPSS